MLLMITLSKFWLFYYDCQLYTFKTNKSWLNAINPINNENSNWFVKNLNKYGNDRYLFKIMLIISFIFTFILAILYFDSFLSLTNARIGIIIVNIVILISVLFIIIGLIYLYIFKIRNNQLIYYDNLGIGKEILLTTYLAIIFIILLIISIILLNYNIINQSIYSLLLAFDYNFVIVCLIIVQIPYSRSMYINYARIGKNKKVTSIASASNLGSVSPSVGSLSSHISDHNDVIDIVGLNNINIKASSIEKKNNSWSDIVGNYRGYFDLLIF